MLDRRQPGLTLHQALFGVHLLAARGDGGQGLYGLVLEQVRA